MMHHMTPTLTQKHILHSMEHLQIEAGIGTHFLTTSYHLYGKYCTKCWLSSLWEDISDLPISIVINNTPLPPLLRENDNYIMDYVISNYNCTTSELKAINRVRLHHKCYTLAHVSSGKGTQFLHLSPSFSSSILPSITFPKTFPTSKDYTIWNSIFSRLPSPSLGPWKITNSSLVTCLYDPHQQHVYIKKSNTWIQY